MPAMDPALRDADKENAAIARAIRAVAGGSLNLGPGGGPPRETPFETRPSRRRRPAAAPAAGEITAFDGNRPRTPPRAERRRSTSNGIRTDLEAPKRVDASAPASPWAPGSVGCDAWGADADADVDAAREPRTKRREKKSDGSSGDAASSGAGAAPGAEAGAGVGPRRTRRASAARERWVTLGRFGFEPASFGSRGKVVPPAGKRAWSADASPYAAGLTGTTLPSIRRTLIRRSPYAERSARASSSRGTARRVTPAAREPRDAGSKPPGRARGHLAESSAATSSPESSSSLSESSPETDDASSSSLRRRLAEAEAAKAEAEAALSAALAEVKALEASAAAAAATTTTPALSSGSLLRATATVSANEDPTSPSHRSRGSPPSASRGNVSSKKSPSVEVDRASLSPLSPTLAREVCVDDASPRRLGMAPEARRGGDFFEEAEERAEGCGAEGASGASSGCADGFGVGGGFSDEEAGDAEARPGGVGDAFLPPRGPLFARTRIGALDPGKDRPPGEGEGEGEAPPQTRSEPPGESSSSSAPSSAGPGLDTPPPSSADGRRFASPGALALEPDEADALRRDLAASRAEARAARAEAEEANASARAARAEAEEARAEAEAANASARDASERLADVSARLAFRRLDADGDGFVGLDDLLRSDQFASYGQAVVERIHAVWDYNAGTTSGGGTQHHGEEDAESATSEGKGSASGRKKTRTRARARWGWFDEDQFALLSRYQIDRGGSMEAVRFWFRVLDADGDGAVTRHDVRWMYDAVYKDERTCVSLRDLTCQVFDMVGAGRPGLEGGISVGALAASKLAAGVVGLLCNHDDMMLRRSTAEFSPNQAVPL